MNYIEMEKWTLEGLDVDYISLDNIVRPFAADIINPKKEEFELALSFLKEFLENNHIRVLYGEDMLEVGEEEPSQIVTWLKALWDNEKYEDFNYAVWFDRVKSH